VREDLLADALDTKDNRHNDYNDEEETTGNSNCDDVDGIES